ncbi:Hypothetical protein BHO_0011302 (plasmid) [Borrelia hermsii YBT]|uniref:Uncharacterized protein n=1 Tax=Borrelia hermsii YBT TaxID=1313295 RepID=W5T2Y1_BORHE|nr:DUF244 domain-containing protein [Borrelia hermsii]AHH13273.1 Hypothetical protein BHO_0011302 [Borrelia hermsii YBT]
MNSIVKFLKSKNDIFIKNIELDELSIIIGDFLKESFVYEELCDVDFKFDFLEFVKSLKLEIDDEEILNLKRCLGEVSALQSEIDRIEEETKKAHALELSRLTKPIKDKLKSQIDDLMDKFSLIEHVNYDFEGDLFHLDMTKRAIKDRFKFLGGSMDFIFSNYLQDF